MIQVVNKRTYTGPWDETTVYVGRPSVLGNPYTHLRGKTIARYYVPTREDALLAYGLWLVRRPSNGPVQEELSRLVSLYRTHGRLTLVCWCTPLPCHADVLARVITRDAA